MAVRPFLGPLAGHRLDQIIIPGSHDAGLARNFQKDLSKLSSPATTVTQNEGVWYQAKAGSRFFDVRIQKIEGELTSFHTAKKPLGKSDMRSLGASGQGFVRILNDLREFVFRNRTEFVIVRLSHLRDSTDVFQELWDWIETPKNSPYVYKGTGNLAGALVRELAGQIVFVIEAKKFKHAVNPPGGGPARVPGQADGFHTFYQNKGGTLPRVTDGLCVCGEFSNKKKLHQILAKQVDNYSHHDQHKNHQADQAHLCALYWTATGGNIEENTQRELTQQNFKQVRKMVNDKLQDNWEKEVVMGMAPDYKWRLRFNEENIARTKFAVKSASIPNIILYDFINDGMSKDIIDLNDLVSR
jgi:hypothetical protein